MNWTPYSAKKKRIREYSRKRKKRTWAWNWYPHKCALAKRCIYD